MNNIRKKQSIPLELNKVKQGETERETGGGKQGDGSGVPEVGSETEGRVRCTKR